MHPSHYSRLNKIVPDQTAPLGKVESGTIRLLGLVRPGYKTFLFMLNCTEQNYHAHNVKCPKLLAF